jgi:endoglucanase
MKKIILRFIFFILAVIPVFKSDASHPVDDFNDSNLNNLQDNQWSPYTDGFSEVKVLFSEERSGKSLRLKTEFKDGATYQYTGIHCYFNQEKAGISLKNFYGIRFRAKGTSVFQVKLPIPATEVEYNHYERDILPGNSWKLYEVPFETMTQKFGKTIPFDLSQIAAVVFGSNGIPGAGSDFYIDDVEFYTFEEAHPVTKSNPVDLSPKVNQLGYQPDAEKYFSITSPNALPGQRFEIVSSDLKKVVGEGHISQKLYDDTESSGEKILRGYFTEFTKEGSYRIKIDTLYSQPFDIRYDICFTLFRHALRTFYTIRCGISVSDDLTGIDHDVCHSGDTIVRKNAAEHSNFTGGWHNAGDYGKWTPMAAISVSYMLWLYELSGINIRETNLEIPDSENGIPDILDQARWGLEWLLKMQRTDGAVFHKVDTQPSFAVGKKPENDTLTRYASFQSATETQEPSSIDAADFTAVMLQAYRVFKSVDLAFAEKCRDAALVSWQWLNSHQGKGQSDIYYPDADFSQEMFWALAEVTRFNPDDETIKRLNSELPENPFNFLSWLEPHSFGYYTITFSENSRLPVNAARNAILSFADQVLEKIDKSGYGTPLSAEQYWWGCNEAVANYGSALSVACKISRQEKYRNGALSCVSYLLGNNALNHSFVTGFGVKSTVRPYHWTYLSYGKIMKGWISGGPNRYENGADPLLISKIKDGTPPAECFVDEANGNGSWASNEGQTSSNAAVMFLAGMIAESAVTNAIADNSGSSENNKFLQSACVADGELVLHIHYSEKGNPAVLNLMDTSGKVILCQDVILVEGKNVYRVNLKEKRNLKGLWIARIVVRENGLTESIKVVNQ